MTTTDATKQCSIAAEKFGVLCL